MRGPLIRTVIILVTAAIVFWLTGCASPPQTITVEKPVMIQSPPVFLPVPPALFEGCLPPPPVGPTNGDLLFHDHLATVYADCLLTHLNAIKALH
jgi:hypothetical protein